MKAVLREIVRRAVGPDVAYRKKQGFTILWSAGSLRMERRPEGTQGRDCCWPGKAGWSRRHCLPLSMRPSGGTKSQATLAHAGIEHWLRKQKAISKRPGGNDLPSYRVLL